MTLEPRRSRVGTRGCRHGVRDVRVADTRRPFHSRGSLLYDRPERRRAREEDQSTVERGARNERRIDRLGLAAYDAGGREVQQQRAAARLLTPEPCPLDAQAIVVRHTTAHNRPVVAYAL